MRCCSRCAVRQAQVASRTHHCSLLKDKYCLLSLFLFTHESQEGWREKARPGATLWSFLNSATGFDISLRCRHGTIGNTICEGCSAS
jgi:hypothetical protein